MEKYIIYCTEEQTMKALELGAPLINVPLKCKTLSDEGCKAMNVIRTSDEGYDRYYLYPTAEQMISWLDEQGQSIEVSRLYRNNPNWSAFVDDTQIVGNYYSTRKEAILAAIDVALDRLFNQ